MTHWLDDEEQANWRAYLEGSSRLADELDRALKEGAGLDLDDYEVLVHLSEAPERRVRMSELAEDLLASRSRLTYRVDRLVAAGLVCRERCEHDGRVVYAVLTDRGWDRLVAAAPIHVSSVRRHLLDAMTPEEFAVIGRVFGAIAASLRDPA